MTNPIYVFNKYYTLYHNIISLAISNNRYKSKEHYYETHHIIPKSFGGSEEQDNKVLLTAREHYICHYLLTKFTTSDHKRKMCFAFNMMNLSSNKHNRTINSIFYNSNKKLRHKIGHSQSTKDKIGKASLGRKHTKESKIKIANANKNKKISQSTKDKISNTNKNRIHSVKSKINMALGKINKGIGVYCTPYGYFTTAKLASNSLLSLSTIYSFCKYNNNKPLNNYSITQSKYLKTLEESPLGKSPKELGFSFSSNE